MRKLRLLLAIAPVCCALLIPSLAKADPACGTMNLSSLVAGTSCTIGDKTFTFTGSQLSLNNLTFTQLPSSDFQIVPDASNPLAPSFTIEAAPGTSIMLSAGSDAEATLNFGYDVSTTNGSATIVGLDSTVSGNVSGGISGSGIGGRVESINSLSSGSGVIFNTTNLPEVNACIQNGGSVFPPGCVSTNGAGSQGPNSISFAPVSSLNGIAIVDLLTDFTSAATLTSATFSIDQIPQTTPTPEPGSLVLLVTGLLVALGACRRTLLS